MPFFGLCQIKTHFLWDCDSVNCTSWEQLFESAPKAELMQYASYRRPKTVKGKVCADLLTSSSKESGCETEKPNRKGEKSKSLSWELFDCLPWPSYWLPIAPSIISQLHQHSKADQQNDQRIPDSFSRTRQQHFPFGKQMRDAIMGNFVMMQTYQCTNRLL